MLSSLRTSLRRTSFVAVPLALATLLSPAATPAGAASVSTWDKVAQCESTGNWSYNKPGHPHFGGLQFLKSTWDAFGGRQYAAYPHQATKEQQIRIAEKVLATQGQGAWPTCGPAAGLAADPADPYPDEPPAPQSKMTNLTQVGDLTGDGVNDLIAVEAKSGDLYRYSGPAYGGGSRVKLGYGWNTMDSITGVGDLTGDGVADILAVDASNGNLYRYSGPNYKGATKVQIGSNWDSMTNIVGVGDLTGNGSPDLLAVEKATGDLYRYSGPSYTGGSRLKIGTGWNAMSSITGVGDLTGDGVADILAVDASNGNLYRYSGP
ncbi:transglycosylase family protein, partial [Streptomyces sp. NPDC057939]|uniref:transglycosylase family protein n=1 Tax=Streptomyces sp. NPDC057939 TaxID=3346284 RepID=UPI0036E91860